MDYRGVLLVGAVLGGGALASSTACTAPDPGAITFAQRPVQAGDSTSPGGSGGPPGSSGTTEGDGGGATPGGPDPVFGSSAFVHMPPAMAANNANAAHGGTVEGKNCIQTGCHLGGAKPWGFAGTVYSAAQGGTVVPKAEIRIVGPDGVEVGKAYTDANGNFWSPTAVNIPAGARVGVRKEGGASKVMTTPLQPADNACSKNEGNCHGTEATGKVFAP